MCFLNLLRDREMIEETVVLQKLMNVSVSAGGNVWVGGGSGAGFTNDTTAFIAEGYGNVHPFEVPNLKDPQIRLLIGYPNDGLHWSCPRMEAFWED